MRLLAGQGLASFGIALPERVPTPWRFVDNGDGTARVIAHGLRALAATFTDYGDGTGRALIQRG